VGTYLTQNLIDAILPEIEKFSGLKREKDLPASVSQVIREDESTEYRFVLNCSSDSVKMDDKFGGFDILSEKNKSGEWIIEGNGVCIFEKTK